MSMQHLAIDDIPLFCPEWPEIAGKAHMYKTARLRSTGEYVSIVALVRFSDGCELMEPAFSVRRTGEPSFVCATDELCAFCL